MKKEITLAIIGFVLGIFLLNIASAQLYFCLRQGETIHLSECNPDIPDYTCTDVKCYKCVTEISSGVYCQTNPNDCNDLGDCTYLYEEPLPPQVDLPVITIISPIDDYSVNSNVPVKIEFDFKGIELHNHFKLKIKQ